MKPNRTRYVESLGQELLAQASRVRDLVGGRHWPSDGFHKEFVLKAILDRHVPAGYQVSRGFVIDPSDDVVSTEQDLVILDMTADSLPFNQGRLAISFPNSVAAALSVKTAFSSATVNDAFSGLMSLASVWKRIGTPVMPWLGGFFFDSEFDQLENGLGLVSREMARMNPIKVPLSMPSDYCFPVCFATLGGLLYQARLEPETSPRRLSVRGRKLSESSSAAFLGLIIDALCRRRGNATFLGDLIENELVVEEEAPLQLVDMPASS